MKIKSTKWITLLAVVILLPLISGCFTIIRIDQTTMTTPGEEVTVHLLVRTEDTDDTPHYGIVGLLIPEDWTVDLVHYFGDFGPDSCSFLHPDSSDAEPGGQVDFWTQELENRYPSGEGMQWVVYQANTPFASSIDTGYVDLYVDMTTGATESDYNLGYFVSNAALDFSDPAYFSIDLENPVYNGMLREPLLLSEFVVNPTNAEFIEIYNPNDVEINLSNYYLTDATYASGDNYYYNIVTGEGYGGGGFFDFHARFPEDAKIGAGEYQTIALNGDSLFFDAYGVLPTYEIFEDSTKSDDVPDMRDAVEGSVDGLNSGLTNGDEVIVLYYWDGVTDLVKDADYVIYDDSGEVPNEAVDKSGVAIDGPDVGDETSTYLDDTPIASQDVAPSPGEGSSSQRMDLTEGTESKSGGNGLTGHNEMSENLSTTWMVDAPTPNAAYGVAEGNVITFKVDLNYLNSIGLFDPATEGAAVRGSFSNWHDTPENLPDWTLSDHDGDLIYEGALDVGEDSPIQYKYVIYTLGTTDVEYESGNNRTLVLTGMPQELDPVVWDVEVTFRVDMTRAQRLGIFNPDSNGVSLRGNFTSWNDDPGTLPDWALDDLGGDMIYTGTFSGFNTAELVYKYVITDQETNLFNWEDAISNRMDTLTTVQDVSLETAFWDSIPPPAEAITANVLFKVDVTPLLELDAFDPTLGDTLQLRGEFNGWSDSDPEKSIMRQSLLSLTQYELTLPIEAVPGDELPYKFFIDYDDQGGTRDVPESGWEEPASTGGANRFYTFTDQTQQTVPTKFFNDIYIEDVIPEGVTVNMQFTTVMNCVLRNPASGLPADGPLQLDAQDPIWRFITGTPNVDNDETALVYEDADNDSLYNLSYDLVGPAPNWVQYKLQWAGQDEEGSDTQAAGRRRVRYIRKNADGSWPATFEMGLDVWNDVVASPLVVETRDGGTIDDEIPCDIEVSVEAADLAIPTEYKLEQNYPNPFNPMTTIEYSLKEAEHVTITIYNQLGQQVALLVDQHQSAGNYKVSWNINDSMSELPSGIYFYRLRAGDYQDTKRLVLLK
ncbi:T9SS type A sorting domain-containing protein [candidate division KSB1 bacterium]|nr:T9SS type A sorting domain-containing protein [candidate division KSB1 bacterium]